LLVIDAMTPTPDKDAGSVDVVSYLRIFRSLSYDVTFIPESQPQHGGEYTAALQRLGVECLYEPHVGSVRAHLEAAGARYDLVMLYRAPTAARHIDDVRRLCPNAKVVFNTVDLHYLREEREAQLEGSAEAAAAAARTKEAELAVIARSDCTIVLSTAEREILGAEPAASGRRIAVMPLIIPVPGRSAPFESRRDVVFVGGFRHRPNVDAAVYFTREIWPLVRPRLRGSRFLVVGSHPPPEILALRGDGIVVAGHVEDLGALFAACRLSVAPIRYGAGIKGKVLTSMSYGVPCVATTMAVEGGDYRDGENVLVADAPRQFADAVVRAHGDGTLWNRLSDRGLAFVEQGYSLDAGRARIEALVAELS
jgi:glycosyltransferase involved in cell wall biosynthesis